MQDRHITDKKRAKLLVIDHHFWLVFLTTGMAWPAKKPAIQ